jgi:hypothetical protein
MSPFPDGHASRPDLLDEIYRVLASHQAVVHYWNPSTGAKDHGLPMPRHWAEKAAADGNTAFPNVIFYVVDYSVTPATP